MDKEDRILVPLTVKVRRTIIPRVEELVTEETGICLLRLFLLPLFQVWTHKAQVKVVREAEEYLQVWRITSDQGIGRRYHVRYGNDAEEILDMQPRKRLICCHVYSCRSGFKRFFLGSVAEKSCACTKAVYLVRCTGSA